MDPFTSSTSVFGGGGIMGFLGAERQNWSNAKQAADQMKFQEDMSNTAHQREVADLRAAGLNPLLSVNRGASTPGGAQATMQNSVSSALDARRQDQEIKNMRQQGINLRNEYDVQNAHIFQMNSAGNRENSAGLLLDQQRLTEQAETELTRNRIPGSTIERKIDESLLGEAARRIERIGGAASSAVGVGRLRGLTERSLPPQRPMPRGWEPRSRGR